jgi:hypothetical protein
VPLRPSKEVLMSAGKSCVSQSLNNHCSSENRNMQDEDLKEYEKILETFTPKPPPEKNIFSIGGRSHYENPISDMLAFFIDGQKPF